MLLTVCASVALGSSTVLVAGEPLRWQGVDDRRPYVPIAVNVSNVSDVSPEEVQLAVVEALLAWQSASGDAFDFDVWIGTDTRTYPVGEQPDGYTTLSFASADPHNALADSVAGHTALYYDEDGWVLEGDIVINDLPFVLTQDPTQTNYSEEGFATRTLLLADVVTHEVGHLLGLGHTGVSTSTMFAGAWVGQSTLGCDDVNGVRELYAPSGGGSVSGQVTIAGVGGAAGLEVYAIGVGNRTIRAAGFTDEDGNYALTGLPDDDYLLLAGPYGGNPDGLPVQLAESYVKPCAVSRGLYGDGALVPVRGDETSLSWSLDCGGGMGLPEDPGLRMAPIEVPVVGGTRVGLAERVPAEEGTWVSLPDAHGSLSLDILSWSLFSPAGIEAELFDAEGRAIPARVSHPMVDHPDAPTWDARIEADDVPPGGVLLHLTGTVLPSSSYPGGRAYLDGDPFAVVVGHVGDETASPADCAPLVDGHGYVRPAGLPVKSARPSELKNGLGCATGAAPAGVLAIALGVLGLRRRR